MDVRFAVTEGMHCASCVRRMEQALADVPGITRVQVDLPGRTVAIRVTADGPAVTALQARLRGAGFTVVPEAGIVPPPAPWPVVSAAVLAGTVFLIPHHWATWVAAVAVAVPGWPILRSGLRWAAPSMDTLIALGALAALAVGEAHAAAVTIALTLIGRLVEARARAATGAAVERLAARAPAQAWRVTAAGEEQIAVAAIAVGDRLRLKPGALVPVDGRLENGDLSVDESLLTGESLPAAKAAGAELVSGTQVVDGSGILVAERIGTETVIARLADLVRSAALTKPTVQRLVDRIAAIFVPLIVITALATWAGWWWLSGDPTHGILPAAAVLVVACPCALGLATPTALAATVGRCAQAGIYVLTPRALEAAAHIDLVAFDKTGTLTQGQFVVERIEGPDPVRTLAVAAAVERGSEHPLALAIVMAHLERQIAPSRGIVQDVRKFTHRRGAGAEAEIDGQAVVIGTAALLREHGIEPLAEPAGNFTVVHVVESGTALGLILLRDAERSEAPEVIAALQRHVRVMLITGDNPGAAQVAANRLGIDEILARCKPEQKLAQIRTLQASGQRVAFVGDGVNDAPVLAGADLGIAVGGATDVAKAAADIVLAGGDLHGVTRVLTAARAGRRTIIANLVLASGYNLVAVPFAALGHLNPALAAGMMALSSLLVVGNSWLLTRQKLA